MPKHEVKLFRTTKEMDKWIMESEYEISKHIVDIILQNMPIKSMLKSLKKGPVIRNKGSKAIKNDGKVILMSTNIIMGQLNIKDYEYDNGITIF